VLRLVIAHEAELFLDSNCDAKITIALNCAQYFKYTTHQLDCVGPVPWLSNHQGKTNLCDQLLNVLGLEIVWDTLSG